MKKVFPDKGSFEAGNAFFYNLSFMKIWWYVHAPDILNLQQKKSFRHDDDKVSLADEVCPDLICSMENSYKFVSPLIECGWNIIIMR